MNGKYKLTLTRKKNFVGCLVKYDIYIDDVKVGKIKNGETVTLDVDAGSHKISIHKNNPVNIVIDKDTTADVVVFGANNFGITNINGGGATNVSENDEHYLERNKKQSLMVLIFSILLPAISAFLVFNWGYYLKIWMYAIVIGYGIVNIAGLKNLKGTDSYKSLLMQNVIGMIICLVAIVITAVYLGV